MNQKFISNRDLVRILLIITAFIVVLIGLFRATTAIIWIFIAFFLALSMAPGVNALQKKMPRKSRGLATGLIMFTVILAVIILGLIILPPLIGQTAKLIGSLPAYYDSFLHGSTPLAQYIQKTKPQALTELLSANNAKLISQFLANFFGGVMTLIAASVTIATFTFFMLLEGPRWYSVCLRYMPDGKRGEYKDLMDQMHQTVTGYVNGNLFTSLIASTTAAIMLWTLGTPYILALSVMVGIINLIPMIGSTLSAVIVSIFVLITGGFLKALISATFFLVYQLFENSYLQNIVYSKAVDISPLVVGISALLGGYIAGFLGALVAIPAAASLQIIVKYFLNKNRPARAN